MNKIPVGQTISYGYSFGFGNFGGVLGIVWIPILLTCVAAYFLYLPMLMALIQTAASGGAPDPFKMQQLMMQSAGSILLFDLIAAFLWSVMLTGVTRLALGIDRPAPFYFSIGKQVWLIFAGMIVLFVALIVLGFIMGIVLSLVDAAIIPSLGDPKTAIIFAIVQMVLVLLLFLFVAIRLGYFICPVTVAEDKFGLMRSWELTAGNFWRIVGVWLAIVLPLLIVFYLAVIAIVMAMGLPAIQAGGGQFPTAMLIAFLVAYFVFAVLMMGMTNGAAAFAYRAVAGGAQPPAAA